MDQTPTPTNNENKPFYQTKEFWMEVLRAAGVVVILAVIVLAGITVYKKLNDSDKASDSDSESRSGLVSRSGDRFPKLKKGEELHIVVTDIKNLCRDENLLIFDEGGKVEFTALNDEAKMIVSSGSAEGKSFDELIKQMVTSTAPLDASELLVSDYCMIYDGYLDNSDHSVGYAYLELILGDNGYYVFVQGLAAGPEDPSVVKARDFSKRLEAFLKLT